MKSKFDVVVVGELNVDIILNEITALPSVGDEILAGKMDVTLGSSSAIFASNISTLGVSTAFLGKIGNDDFGRTVLNSLKEKHVNTDSIIESSGKKTGASIALSYDNDRAMITFPGAMDELSASDVKDSYLESGRHLHVSSVFIQPIIKNELISLFSRAKQRGMTTSLDLQCDPANKWDIDFENVLPLVDVFLPNNHELMALAHRKSIDEAIEVLKPCSNILVVKMGQEGSIGIMGNNRIVCEPFLNDHVVDAIGAGDSFNAGFISAFINGKMLGDCLRLGNICGAVNTTAAGGTGAFNSLRNVQKTAEERFGFDIKQISES